MEEQNTISASVHTPGSAEDFTRFLVGAPAEMGSTPKAAGFAAK
jgi:hypothetical protein